MDHAVINQADVEARASLMERLEGVEAQLQPVMRKAKKVFDKARRADYPPLHRMTTKTTLDETKTARDSNDEKCKILCCVVLFWLQVNSSRLRVPWCLRCCSFEAGVDA